MAHDHRNLQLSDVLAREAIRETIAEYNGATDRGDLSGVAACFTADGSLQIADDDPIPRATIAETLATVLTDAAGDRPPPAYVHHHVSTTRFTAIANGDVRTDSYFVVFTQIGADHWGRYRDVHALEDHDWRIRTRRILTDGFAPLSLLKPSDPANRPE